MLRTVFRSVLVMLDKPCTISSVSTLVLVTGIRERAKCLSVSSITKVYWKMQIFQRSVTANSSVLYINLLKTKQICFIKGIGPYRAVNTFHIGYKNQSVYAVSGTSRCLFSIKYKTHKYGLGRTYSCWMLNWWCITWQVGFERFMLRQLRSPPPQFVIIA